MLGGINNGLFFQGFGGFLAVVLILIPLLKWTFNSSKAQREHKDQVKRLKRDLKKLKRK